MHPARPLASRLLGVGLVGLLLAIWATLGGCCSMEQRRERGESGSKVVPAAVPEDNGPAIVPAADDTPAVDLESRPLPRIPAGTVIGKAAPEGWTNFIMIAVPTLTKEDIRDAPKVASHYAQMFKFTLLAQTEKDGDRYRLKTVARGFATTVKDREIVIDSKKTFGADLAMFGRKILDENEKHIDADLRQVARTPTMCVFDAQAVMRRDKDHVRMVLRHVVLVEPASGTVHAFLWLLSKDGEGYAVAEKELQRIPEATREERLLSVKRDKFVLGMPTPEAFALVRTPQGQPVAWTPELEKLAAVKSLSKEQVGKLEALLLKTGRAAAKK